MNKKLKLTFILLISVYSLFSQCLKDRLQGQWITIRSKSYNSDEYNFFNNHIFDFDNDSLRFRNIFYKDGFSYTCTFNDKDSVLTIRDSIVYKIKYISNDSIKLVNDINDVAYIKFPFTSEQSVKIDKEELINSSWNYKVDNVDQRIEFSNTEWYNHNDDALNCYTYSHNKNDISNYNKWMLFELDGRTYLSRTFDQCIGVLHAITDVVADTIFLKAWIPNTFCYPKLIKYRDVSKPAKTEVMNNLLRKKWKVTKVDYDTTSVSGFHNDILKRKLKFHVYGNRMFFSFNNDSLKIYNSRKVYMNEKYRITNDTANLITECEEGISFFHINKVTKDSLVLVDKDNLMRFMYPGVSGIDYKIIME